tara:strand:- start:502 stop:1035 length:534 start_codon:yes stop_codon:yes gene_type:complete
MFLFFACFIFYKLSPQNRKDVVFLNGEKNTWVPKTNSIFSTIPSNILMNPHTPPLKNNSYFPRDNSNSRGVPINISTRGVDSAYSQMGILTRLNGEETILPIMGRPLFSNRSKWQYYTMSDKSNSIKLPMSHNGRSCTNEYGCNELMSGDTVYVEGYKDAFKTTIYENSQPRYIPYL